MQTENQQETSPQSPASPPTEAKTQAERFYFLRVGDRSIVVNGIALRFVPMGDDLSYYITDKPELAKALRETYISRRLAGLQQVTREQYLEKKSRASSKQLEVERRSQSSQPLSRPRLQAKPDLFGKASSAAKSVAGAAAGRIPRLSTVIPDPKTPVQEKIARETAKMPVPPPTDIVPKAEPLEVPTAGPAKADPPTEPPTPPPSPAKKAKAVKAVKTPPPSPDAEQRPGDTF